MKTIEKGIRTNLKVFRVRHNLSQAEMAEKLGVGRASYSAIENGKRTGRMYFWDELQKAFDLENSDMWELMKVDE